MITKPAGGTTMLLVLVATLAPPALHAQDPCPSASGPDAEAGWSAYQAGDMARARRAFERALDTCAGDQYARTGLGYVELRAGNDEAAGALFRTVVDAEPNNVDALVGLGLVAWRSGDRAAVRQRFERVLVLAPTHPTAVEYLARLDGTAASGPTDEADRAWAAGDHERAFALYSGRLDRDPTDGVALLRAGLIHAWREEYAASLELLDLLVDLEPGNFDGRVARARVYAWMGDLPRGTREVESVLAVAPEHSDALAALATFQAWSGDVEASLESYERLLSISPGDAGFRRQAARTRVWAEQSERAIRTYRDLLAEDADDLEARLGLASALAFAGDYDASLTEYDRVLAAEPSEMRALTGRSKALLWAGRLAASQRAALRAIDVDRASGAAWSALGASYRAQGRTAAALEAFETAEGFSPSDPEIRDQLRALRLSLRPAARPTVVGEDDSDGNRMLTTALVAGWHPVPRLDVEVRGWHKRLEQEGFLPLERRVTGGTVTGRYQLRPGWLLTGSVGGFASDRDGDGTFLSGSAAVRSPDRHPLGVTLDLATTGLDETAAIVERGVRSTTGTLAVRWLPDGLWRLDGSLSVGSYEATESNGRRGWFVGVSRRLSVVTLGLAHRGFSFEKNVNDGYFDPDYYGVVELTGYWQHRTGPWRLLVELAPGVEQVRSDGDPSASLRARLRGAYAVDTLREVSLSVGYSTAGLSSFATGAAGYRYLAVILGVDWVL